MRRISKRAGEAADVDVTSFINLVIVLVPVLLMGMVLSHITVLKLKLPDVAAGGGSQEQMIGQLELVVRANYIDIDYPAGTLQLRIEKNEKGKFDFDLLRRSLQDIKRQLADQGIEKRDFFLLSEKATDYQTLVSVMDTARSYKTVIGTSVVTAELFPDVSLGDAPIESDKAIGEPSQGGKP
jgi:biopolymer transport protein ExbD